LATLIVLALDGLSKALAQTHLHPRQPLAVTANLDLVLAYNPGLSGGFLSGFPQLAIGLSAIACLGLAIYIYRYATASWVRIGLGMALGGGIGNLIEHLFQGQVTDFLLVHLGPLHTNIFNIADFAISLGVLMAIPHLLTKDSAT
jgi:signal peptidase II